LELQLRDAQNMTPEMTPELREDFLANPPSVEVTAGINVLINIYNYSYLHQEEHVDVLKQEVVAAGDGKWVVSLSIVGKGSVNVIARSNSQKLIPANMGLTLAPKKAAALYINQQEGSFSIAITSGDIIPDICLSICDSWGNVVDLHGVRIEGVWGLGSSEKPPFEISKRVNIANGIVHLKDLVVEAEPGEYELTFKAKDMSLKVCVRVVF
jgi:hypothetical protein